MTETDHTPLELSPEQIRQLVDEATSRVLEHLAELPGLPTRQVDLEHPAVRVEQTPPEEGAPLAELLDHLFDDLVPNSFANPSGGFMAFIPGGGILHSAVADLIANAVNRYVTVWAAAPGLAALELSVVRWFCHLVGYPREASGFLATGGSLANFSGLFTARRERLPENFLAGRIYCADQVHHSVNRAATLAGFPGSSLRTIGVDAQFRLRVDELAAAVAEDRAAGAAPFLVVASAGTTNTGAVDDLEAIADLCEREELWLHVDAAYGGFFVLTERGRRRMRGLERADSLSLDPHKGLFLPYGTGCLLVRDGAALARAHEIHADYMPPMQHSNERVDFCNISPELSRDFRGLRVWLPVKMHGIDAFRRALDEKLDLAEWAADELRAIDHMQIVAEPQLSVVAFRLEPPGVEGEALDELNRELIERVNRRQRAFLTGTMLAGRFALRICVVTFRTHKERVAMAVEDVREEAAELVGS